MPTSPPGARGRKCSLLLDLVLYRCRSGGLSAAAPFEVVGEERAAEQKKGLAGWGGRRRGRRTAGRVREPPWRRRAREGEEGSRGKRPVAARLAAAAAAMVGRGDSGRERGAVG
jgi:hypothetical protein